MSLRWLSSMVGGNKMARPGIRRKMAPEAQRDLSAEIDTDAVGVRGMFLRDLILDPTVSDTSERTAIARLKVWEGSPIDVWLNRSDDDGPELDVRTDWIFFPATPEAVLMCAAEDPTSGERRFRFNLRLPADEYRRHLTVVAQTGSLGLTTVPLQISEDGWLESPCVFVTVPEGPLRQFLREIPAAPVV